MVFIYSTFDNAEEAQKIGAQLVEKRLAACINIWHIGSIYRDNGDVKQNKEVAMLIKTVEIKYADIERHLNKNHGYEVPCIAMFKTIRLNAEYKEWLAQCVAM